MRNVTLICEKTVVQIVPYLTKYDYDVFQIDGCGT